MENVNQIISLMKRIESDKNLKDKIVKEMMKAYNEKREPKFINL